jgi:hypothetical protein
MSESFKIDKNLTNKLDNLDDDLNFDRETKVLKLLEALSEKIKLLENKGNTSNVTKKDNCDFKHTCYVAKSKMGPCPCELYR